MTTLQTHRLSNGKLTGPGGTGGLISKPIVATWDICIQHKLTGIRLLTVCIASEETMKEICNNIAALETIFPPVDPEMYPGGRTEYRNNRNPNQIRFNSLVSHAFVLQEYILGNKIFGIKFVNLAQKQKLWEVLMNNPAAMKMIFDEQNLEQGLPYLDNGIYIYDATPFAYSGSLHPILRLGIWMGLLEFKSDADKKIEIFKLLHDPIVSKQIYKDPYAYASVFRLLNI